MKSWQSRSKPLFGKSGIEKLSNSRILIVGVGGVGGHALETLVRCGVGSITIVDGDVFDETNLNRQILATTSNIGRSKAEEGAIRAAAINSEIKVTAIPMRFNAQTAENILACGYDYVLDCIDSVGDKVALITECYNRKINCISAMGAANRLDTDFVVSDIYSTEYDGLARAVRRRLRAAGIPAHKIVYSKSEVTAVKELSSVAFPPAICGITMAKEVVLELIRG